jgi:histidinol-phosphatase (PHP family)
MSDSGAPDTVLTDYHVHLRTDDEGTDAEKWFTPENAQRYREHARARGIEELGVAEHVHRFTAALDVWRHPFWEMFAVDDLDDYVRFVREDTDLRLGIEADFVPGAEDRMANLLDAHEWDYVVGSVHFLRDRSLDLEEWDVWKTSDADPDKVWRKYFETLAEAARSGMYDILAHPDLVKIWGSRRPVPEGDLRRFYEPAVEAVAESGIAIEVSTAGLRKPVGEIYPSRPLLEMFLEAGAPIALSSDAHVAEQLGFGYEQALELLADFGVTELCVFEGRERRMVPIGSVPSGE